MKNPFDLEQGHATDVALTALADGQDEIVPSLVTAHVDACDRCAGRLGDLAHVAARADLWVHDARPVQSIAPETAAMDAAKVPWRLVAGGLFVAFVGTAFDMSASAGRRLQALYSRVHNAPLDARSVFGSLGRVLQEREGSVALVAMLASLMLCAVTVAVAKNRFLPEKSS